MQKCSFYIPPLEIGSLLWKCPSTLYSFVFGILLQQFLCLFLWSQVLIIFSHACSHCFRQLGSHSRNCQNERHYAAIPLNPHLTPLLHHPTHPSPIWWGQCLAWASGGGGWWWWWCCCCCCWVWWWCDGKKQDIYCISPSPYQPSARSKFCTIHILNIYIYI